MTKPLSFSLLLSSSLAMKQIRIDCRVFVIKKGFCYIFKLMKVEETSLLNL